MSYHTIILVGNLGRDPEMRYTPSGQAVTNFSVAVDDSYTNNSGERVDRTIWFRVSTWGKLAEVCNNYLKKGRKVLVEGRMVIDPATGGPRTFTRNDGSAGANLEVNANTVRFLSSRSDDQGYQASDTGQVSETDEIPF
ncbi:MAG: single-stranded DNA-binding protein [Anaerolineales bacterium]|jgi:single-strand DNA-binding protein